MAKQLEKNFQKKVKCLSGSYSIIIPIHIIHELKIKHGELAEITIAKIKGRVTKRK